jgi:hypothetical protein
MCCWRTTPSPASAYKNGFGHLDGEPEAAAALAEIEPPQRDFSQWYALQGRRPSPGSPKLQWPETNEARLGMQLQLFRSIARGDTNAGVLGKVYVPGSGVNTNDNAHAFIDQVFRPMSREVIRYLRRVGQQKQQQIVAPDSVSVPASDRIVNLDHNSDPYRQTMEALEAFKKALEDTNLFADTEDKEQRIAEVSAAQELLKPNRVNATAVLAIITTVVTYISLQFADTVLDMFSHRVIDSLRVLLGI